VTRGILIDMARLKRRSPRTRIYADDIEAWEQQTGGSGYRPEMPSSRTTPRPVRLRPAQTAGSISQSYRG
jgi:hypothetical protein